MVKVPESEMKVLTNSEAQELLSQGKLTNHRFYPVWVVALFTGMRSGEDTALLNRQPMNFLIGPTCRGNRFLNPRTNF